MGRLNQKQLRRIGFIFILLGGSLLTLDKSTAEISWGFSQSKKIAKELYKQNKRSFYCNCQIVYEGAKLSPDVEDCGYLPRNKKQKLVSRMVEPKGLNGSILFRLHYLERPSSVGPKVGERPVEKIQASK